MSLLALAVVAAAAVAPAAVTPTPVHSVAIEHRGSTYSVDYRARVETSMRTIGIAPPTRQSTQRCVMTAKVSVERIIADGGHALAASIPGAETFTRQLPGDCRSRDAQLARLVDDKTPAITAHLAKAAGADREHAIAAIDAAHHFAAN
ncbi:hypothetical protein [Novosphingobium guangzhouense]|uniref:UrcA family protein n=1 Tax=Novosphingobium guangzhouense TaxID=1850347 RepID=A0A2K2FT67_9SPHN|nr:hypothetical protein [Novosphingobium guangzhouense]PNU01985.1 hypothetical protein A8V01_11070 [Novosphingobium guangzhouense]